MASRRRRATSASSFRRWNPVLAAAETKRIVTVLRLLDADVVSLQRVEKLDALTRLNHRHLQGMAYEPHRGNGRETLIGQDEVFLTRLDPDEKQWRANREGVSRNIRKNTSNSYNVTFAINWEQTAFIGVHFPSGPLDPSRLGNRQAQTNSISASARRLDEEGFHVVIASDIDGRDGSPDASDQKSNQPVLNVLTRLPAIARQR